MAETCKDKNCSTHGTLKVHGRTFTVTVHSTRSQKTAIIEFERRYFVPKYDRYEKRRTKLHVHSPECINAKDGDIVKIQECRPLSKTKNFVITARVGAERLFAEEAARMEESRVKQSKKKAEEAAQ